MTPIEIARIAHEVNRAYCQALGDDSQVAWEVAPEWQRASALVGVQLHLQNPNAGPEASHASWLEEKRRAGWRYGTVKDPVAKTHPCFVEFAALPRDQQAKDYIFCAVVHALAPHVESGALELGAAVRAVGEAPLLSVLEGDDILSPVGPGPERAEPQAHAKLPNRPVTFVTGGKSNPQ